MNIPFNYIHCFATEAQCSKCGTCLRSIAATMPTENREPVRCVHPSYISELTPDAECQYYRPNRTVRVARGFKHLCDNIPHQTAQHIMAQVESIFTSRCTYFRRKNGSLPLTAQEERTIALIFKHNGIDEPPVFDRYEDIPDW